MAQSQEAIEAFLDTLGIPHKALTHQAVFTVSESADHIADKTPVKNLLLYEEKGSRKCLIIMAGLKRLNTRQLEKSIGAKKLRFASPEMLLDTLGITPGSVSLFCLLHAGSKEVEVAIDSHLLSEDEVGFHPGINTATVFIPGPSIIPILKQTGHRYTHILL